MRKTAVMIICIAMVLAAVPAGAINLGTTVWVPAAARGGGVGDSMWITDLYVYNPGTTQVSVEIYWLDRDSDNSGAAPQNFTVNAGETMVIADVVQSVFGLDSANGALRIVAGDEVMVNSRIYNQADGGETFGQGFEGVPGPMSIPAGSSTDFLGLADTGNGQGSFRTNIFAVNTDAGTTEITFSLRDTSGSELASKSYTLQPWAAFYKPVSALGGPEFDEGTMHVEVTQGSAIVVGSKVDNSSTDPTTLESWWACGDCEECEECEVGGDGIYVGFHQYFISSGLTVIVENDAITGIGGSVILVSPFDGGTNCKDAFNFYVEPETPWEIDSSGNFSGEFTTEDTPGCVFTYTYAGVSNEDALTGTLDLTIGDCGMGVCTGEFNTAPFFAGHTPF
jgi:hypothetical protein